MLSLFSLGFLAGAVVMFVLVLIGVDKTESWEKEETKEFITRHFAEKLELNEEQRAKFKPIVYEILDRRWKMRSDYIENNIAMIEGEFLPRLAEFLTEKQMKKARGFIGRWRREDAAKLRRAGRKQSPSGRGNTGIEESG